MRQNNYVDPLLLEIYGRQNELLKEAASDRLARAAQGRPGRDGRSAAKKRIAEVTIWRRTAWSLGRTAFSVGSWLLAR